VRSSIQYIKMTAGCSKRRRTVTPTGECHFMVVCGGVIVKLHES
jgi:hypothetical protein